MRKIFLVILILIFSFSFVFAQKEDAEIIGVDHTRGPVAKFLDLVVDFSDSIFNIIDKLTNNLTEEVERRQKIFENEVEERKKDLLNKTSEKINQLIKDFIDMLFQEAEDELLNPEQNEENNNSEAVISLKSI